MGVCNYFEIISTIEKINLLTKIGKDVKEMKKKMLKLRNKFLM